MYQAYLEELIGFDRDWYQKMGLGNWDTKLAMETVEQELP